MNQNQYQSQNLALDIINILSFIVGIANMLENEEQSKQNDVQAANQQQAEYILNHLKTQFEKQNSMLSEILDKLNS